MYLLKNIYNNIKIKMNAKQRLMRDLKKIEK